MVLIKKLELDNLPDENKFNGTMTATAIFYDINPVLILEEHANNQGPDLTLAIDYYGPAAAARMGLPVSRTQYIVKSKGTFDYVYKEALLPPLKKDEWGSYHAGDGDLEWKNIEISRLKLILEDAGEKPTDHIGKTGIFIGRDEMPRRRVIGGYDGTHYYNLEGQVIFWNLVRVERAES